MNQPKKILDKITFKTIAVEVFSVVFAVLLALGLNNWWQERSNEKLGEEALKNIVLEMERNMHELDTAMEQLQSQLDLLNSERERYENNKDSTLTLGYSHTVLSDNAWKTANITQAVLYVDPELIMEISDLYSVQELYSDFGNNYFKQYSSLEFNKEGNSFTALNSNIKQVEISMIFAEQLREGYREFFNNFGDRLPK